MSPHIFLLMCSGLVLGTMITVTSSHWLMAWMGLEINTLAILPLMAQAHHPRAVEAATKYFLTQAAAAATLLFASIINAWISGLWEIQMINHPVPTTMMVCALALKLGLAPMHTWLPEVLQGLDLTTGLILSTWQKLAPFALLMQISHQSSHLMLLFGLTSTLVGGWGGLNQTQMRKILAYSSIAHLGWMVIVVQFSPSLTSLALITYIAMTSTVFIMLKMHSLTTINGLSTSWTKAPLMASALPLTLLALGGLPPTTGFAPKWFILMELVNQGLPLVATITALSALLSLYFYLRISYSSSLTSSPNNLPATASWRLKPSTAQLPLAALTMATLLFLPLTPSFIAILWP
uniref:NADH-ubiquinone oxidoreductase chain 2 n=1 Tax=Pandaka pygmaea TaxID=1480109 RepID=A0A1S5QIV8_9GOBI|nr:NADH dehydrogenase subunit 2 [Pandaka pygmaea]